MKRTGGLVWACLLPVCAACSSAGPTDENRKPVHPVRGQVFVHDKPADGAFVWFVPENEAADTKDPRPHAYVEKDGSFALSTYGDKDGAPAGKYLVCVRWPRVVDGREEGDRLQERYTDPKRPSLRATIKEGNNQLVPFKLN